MLGPQIWRHNGFSQNGVCELKGLLRVFRVCGLLRVLWGARGVCGLLRDLSGG